jgi:uncharacterized membrane protein (UPF0127 family)
MLAAGAIGGNAALAALQQSSLTIDTAAAPRRFTIDLAVSAEDQAQGLMFRRSLPRDAGMLFDFGRTRPAEFWMKNTLIPLDMLFVDQRGRIINIHERAVPGSLEPIAAAAPARAVIELNGGTAARLGIKPGDRVIFPIFGDAS